MDHHVGTVLLTQSGMLTHHELELHCADWDAQLNVKQMTWRKQRWTVKSVVMHNTFLHCREISLDKRATRSAPF